MLSTNNCSFQVQDYYTYSTVSDIVNNSEKDIYKCRTIGILESIHGRFNLSDIVKASSVKVNKLKVSTCYLKCTLQSAVKPYPVQVFGTVQWRKEPILFAMMIQVLPTRTALGLVDVMNRISHNFIAPENITETDKNEWVKLNIQLKRNNNFILS